MVFEGGVNVLRGGAGGHPADGVIARTLRDHADRRSTGVMLTRIDHIGIACFDLDKTVEFYRATYGFEVFHTEVNEEQGVREAMLKINETSDGGASYLQLLEPTREDSTVAKWLAKNGEGVHHIAFGTEDVDADAASVRDKGVRVLYDSPRKGSMGSRITFLHPKDCHGVLTELVTSAKDH
ncbi:methylmalonyl-CoA epimerase [Actinacidiphila glaucinigra]|uniref:Methylmalonyl-CoA epimerase n=2 Tax=Kitasatosporales TaxID=85011 RepID=A0A239H9P6_9ACTN|nr:methylmalonyl-CoA epimerase [Actinacidiphila glaucinigra]